MKRILLDQNLPIGLIGVLAGHDVLFAGRLGWGDLENGALLLAAEQAGFELMITADHNIRYQQKLSGRLIALLVLSTNHWPTLRPNVERIKQAVHAIGSSSYRELDVERHPRRRRQPESPL